MYEEIKLAVIGTGRWGFNHVRTASKILGENFNLVCDSFRTNEERIREISAGIRMIEDPREIAANPEINAVIIATPAATHFKIAKEMLEAGKNALVEKPITLNLKEAKALKELSEKANKKLMVGHILLFHPAVAKLKEIIRRGEIGNLEYVYSNRLNLGRVRQEENILWSFAPHDISVLQYLIEAEPLEIYAHGARYLQKNIEDTTITYLKYPGNINAHIFVNWLHPFKEQRLVVIGSKGMVVFQDNLPKEKLRLYHRGYEFENGNIIKGEKDYEVIDFEPAQPLELEQKHFFESIIRDFQPLTDGKHAMEVMKILEDATEKLRKSV